MISLIPVLNKQFTAFATQALESEILSDRERTIAVLAAALVLEDNNSVKQAIIAAKQLGISNEEIGNVSAIVVAMRGLRIANLGITPNTESKTSQSTCCQ